MWKENSKAAALILAISAVAITFLFWLIYFQPPAADKPFFVRFLPALNAALNALSAFCLLNGYRAIRYFKRQNAHRTWMLTAFVFSSLFLLSYITYYYFHGNTKFLAQGLIRPLYFAVLISHIFLSIFALPLCLGSFYLGLSQRLVAHRRLSRWTYPLWLYVSVTGVLIYFLQRVFNSGIA